MHFLLPLLFATAVVPQAQAGISVDTHARAPDAFATQPGGAGMELDLTPTLALGLVGRDQTLLLDYSLRAAWITTAFEPAPALVHTGRLSYTGRLGPRLELLANGWARYGEETWLLALAPADALPELLPRVGRITVGAGTGLAVLRYRATPTQTLQVSAGYDASGGMDTLARAVLPLGYGPRAALSIAQAVGGRDTVTGQLTWQHTEFSVGPAYDLAGVRLDWERRFDARTRLIPSVGVVVSRDARVPVAPAAFQLHPALSLAARHRFLWPGMGLTLEGRLWTGPALNRLDGTLEDQAGFRAEGALQVSRRLTASLRLDQVAVLGSPSLIDGSLQALGAGAAYTVATGLQVQAGLQVYYQTLPARLAIPGLAGAGWDLFVGVRGFVGTAPADRPIDPGTGREHRPDDTGDGGREGTGGTRR